LPYNERDPRKLRRLTPEELEYKRRLEPIIERGLAEGANGQFLQTNNTTSYKPTTPRKSRGALTSAEKRQIWKMEDTLRRAVKTMTAEERRTAANGNQDDC
jgi:hypothetical protein